MGYESLRFSWQKLLINQVPQMSSLPASDPPLPDYTKLWADTKSVLQESIQTVRAVEESYSRAKEFPNSIVNINTDIDAQLVKLSQVYNTIGSIPDSVVTDPNLNKSSVTKLMLDIIATLNGSRLQTPINTPSVEPYIPTPPSSSTLGTADALQSAYLTAQLGYDTTKYRSSPVLGCLPNPVIRYPVNEVIDNSNPLNSREGEWEPTGKIEGVGTYTFDMGFGLAYSQFVIVYADDGKQYSSPGSVPKGLRWSYKPWRWKPKHMNDTPYVSVSPTVVVLKSQSEYDMLQQEVSRQTAQLQSINRIMNKPIDPVPPENIYPKTSWQYEFWNKGYSLQEISYAEDQAAKTSLLDKTNGDFALFKVRVEDILQDAIISKAFNPPLDFEICPLPRCGVGSDGKPIAVIDDYKQSIQMPYQPTNPVADQPTLSIPPVPLCNLPVPYFDDVGNKIDPKKVPSYLRRQRRFQSRNNRNRPIDLDDLPHVITCAPNTVPTKGNWEDCLVGAGATVDELDTVRRTMSRSKLAPNADICNVAKNMLSSVRNQVSVSKGEPAIAVAYDGKGNAIPPQTPVMFGANTINNIAGVAKCGISPAAIVKSNFVARRRGGLGGSQSAIRSKK